MAGEKKDILDSIDSSNIFDEFETGELKEEFHVNKKNEKKDMYSYLSIIAGILSILFWVGLIITGGLYGYTVFQGNPESTNKVVLNPICNIIVGSTPLPNDKNNCMSVSAMDIEYKNNLVDLKGEQAKKILNLLVEIYKTQNFNKSKEVVFLNDKSKNKLKVLEILNKFDALRYNYDKNETQRIQCRGFNISDDGILTTSCTAYSSNFENNIKGFDGTDNNLITGTSISLANSFLNYIEKQSDDFILLDRQKSFTSEGYFSEFERYTKKTNFELKLQYNGTLINK